VKDIDRGAFSVEPGRRVRLTNFDPGSTDGFESKRDARAKLRTDIKHLSALQEIFYARSQYALLIIFQGMDTAGKDGAIKHVMTGVNPQGVDVRSFKAPNATELAHDYLWRCAQVLPERGKIGIFNRSYYEELVIARVHPAILENEQLPPEDAGNIWADRYQDIGAFERHLARNGTLILKFFLHLSKEEQCKRLLGRIDTPSKNWKLSAADVPERDFWDAYQHAYEELLTHTSIEAAPWHVIPADHKWFTRAAIAEIIVGKLESLGLHHRSISDEQRAQMLRDRERLMRGDDRARADRTRE